MKKFILTLASLLTVPTAYADNLHDCIYLKVSINNQTAQACELFQSKIVHGHLSEESSLPKTISAHESHILYLRQSHVGPEATLAFRCGENTQITLHSQQNLCFFTAGSIHTRVSEAKHLNASESHETGSSWGGKPGKVTWILHQ